MYDHINVGDLVYFKRRINLIKDNTVYIVLSKRKTINYFEFIVLYDNKIKTYLLNYKNNNPGNITIHLA